jgi:hypothetical protein
LANAELNDAVLRLGAQSCSAEQLAAVHVDEARAKDFVARIDIDALAVLDLIDRFFAAAARLICGSFNYLPRVLGEFAPRRLSDVGADSIVCGR